MISEPPRGSTRDRPPGLNSQRRRRRWPRWLAIGVSLVAIIWAVLRLWPAPEDRGHTRPVAVAATPFAQLDVMVPIAADDRILRFRAIDEGPRDAPVVILLPGHTSRIEEYDALIPALAQSFRVRVFDFPGTGYSEKPERDYTVRYYEDALIAFMNAESIETAHLAGGSLGANVLLGAAARYPDRFERLVPWSPGSAWPASPRLAAAGRALMASYLFFWPTVKIQSRFWHSDEFSDSGAARDAVFDYYDEVMGPAFVQMYWGLALDTLGRSLFSIAPRVPHPTLLLYGKLDTTPHMQEGVVRIHQLLPHSELEGYSNAGHALASEALDPLTAAIREFLTRPADQLP